MLEIITAAHSQTSLVGGLAISQAAELSHMPASTSLPEKPLRIIGLNVGIQASSFYNKKVQKRDEQLQPIRSLLREKRPHILCLQELGDHDYGLDPGAMAGCLQTAMAPRYKFIMLGPFAILYSQIDPLIELVSAEWGEISSWRRALRCQFKVIPATNNGYAAVAPYVLRVVVCHCPAGSTTCQPKDDYGRGEPQALRSRASTDNQRKLYLSACIKEALQMDPDAAVCLGDFNLKPSDVNAVVAAMGLRAGGASVSGQDKDYIIALLRLRRLEDRLDLNQARFKGDAHFPVGGEYIGGGTKVPPAPRRSAELAARGALLQRAAELVAIAELGESDIEGIDIPTEVAAAVGQTAQPSMQELEDLQHITQDVEHLVQMSMAYAREQMTEVPKDEDMASEESAVKPPDAHQARTQPPPSNESTPCHSPTKEEPRDEDMASAEPAQPADGAEQSDSYTTVYTWTDDPDADKEEADQPPVVAATTAAASAAVPAQQPEAQPTPLPSDDGNSDEMADFDVAAQAEDEDDEPETKETSAEKDEETRAKEEDAEEDREGVESEGSEEEKKDGAAGSEYSFNSTTSEESCTATDEEAQASASPTQPDKEPSPRQRPRTRKLGIMRIVRECKVNYGYSERGMRERRDRAVVEHGTL